jgi:hypothetical protein
MNCLTCLLPDPTTLRLDQLAVTTDGAALAFAISSIQACGHCPLCGQEAIRVHSHYHRTVADLPGGGLPVQLTLTVRRFFCDQPDCPRRILPNVYHGCWPRGPAGPIGWQVASNRLAWPWAARPAPAWLVPSPCWLVLICCCTWFGKHRCLSDPHHGCLEWTNGCDPFPRNRQLPGDERQ